MRNWIFWITRISEYPEKQNILPHSCKLKQIILQLHDFVLVSKLFYKFQLQLWAQWTCIHNDLLPKWFAWNGMSELYFLWLKYSTFQIDLAILGLVSIGIAYKPFRPSRLVLMQKIITPKKAAFRFALFWNRSIICFMNCVPKNKSWSRNREINSLI